MTTGSGGGVPSSSITRPLTYIGVGMAVGWLVGVVVGVVVGGVREPGVAVVPVLPVDGAGVVPPLLWASTPEIDKADAAVNAIVLTQTFEAIPPPLPAPHYAT
jgi:hypothetical protein